MASTISKMFRGWTGTSKFEFTKLTTSAPPMCRFVFNSSRRGTTPENEESGFLFLGAEKRKLFYKKLGSGSSCLLFLPGSMGTADSDFWPQMKYLSKQKYTIIGWDPPGYGKSQPPDRDVVSVVPALYEDARLAHAMMKELQLENFSILGWGEGGLTGIILAALFPEAVEKLVIWGSGSFVTQEDVNQYAKIRYDKYRTHQAYAGNITHMYGEEYFQNAGMESYPKAHSDGVDICSDQLKKIVCPTLILHGMKEHFYEKRHTDYSIERIPNSKLYLFPEGGHNLHLTCSDEFNYLVDEFLTETSSSGQKESLDRA